MQSCWVIRRVIAPPVGWRRKIKKYIKKVYIFKDIDYDAEYKEVNFHKHFHKIQHFAKFQACLSLLWLLFFPIWPVNNGSILLLCFTLPLASLPSVISGLCVWTSQQLLLPTSCCLLRLNRLGTEQTGSRLSQTRKSEWDAYQRQIIVSHM